MEVRHAMRTDAMLAFVTLVETGSYAAAADRLYTSTSTVHSKVKSLEAELGAALIVFAGRTLELTDAGNRFLLFAERTLADLQQIQDETPKLGRGNQRSLRVVALPTMASHVLPRAVRHFTRLRPDVRVTLDGRRIGEAVAAMVSRQADVAIMLDAHVDFAHDLFEVVPIRCVGCVVVARNTPEVAGAPPIELLQSWPISAQPRTNLYRQYLEKWARDQGININVKYEHTLFGGIVDDVLSEDCLGLISDQLVDPHRSHLHVLALPQFGVAQTMVAVYSWRADTVAREFVSFLQRHFSTDHRRRSATEATDSTPARLSAAPSYTGLPTARRIARRAMGTSAQSAKGSASYLASAPRRVGAPIGRRPGTR